MADFNYSNLPLRPNGPLIRLGAKVSRGVRKVQDQIVPYALDWQLHNQQALAEVGKPVWVVLGDSMSQGVGAGHHKRGLIGQLDEMLKTAGRDYRIINLSISGARIRDVLDIQLPAMHELGLEPALITVMVGANDLTAKKRRSEAVAAYTDLLQTIPLGSVVGNVLGMGLEALAMNKLLRQEAERRGLVIADIRKNMPRSWRGLVAEDRFHPNEAGYRYIAQVFAEALGLPVPQSAKNVTARRKPKLLH